MTIRQNLILLDFSEEDTLAALEELMDMAHRGEIGGMVFSVMLTTHKKRRVMLGATGRASRNLIEATGLSALLNCKLTTAAMELLEHNG